MALCSVNEVERFLEIDVDTTLQNHIEFTFIPYVDAAIKRFLGYDWEHNSGYGTPKHIAGLKKLGVCSEHRKSYKPIKKLLNG